VEVTTPKSCIGKRLRAKAENSVYGVAENSVYGVAENSVYGVADVQRVISQVFWVVFLAEYLKNSNFPLKS